VCSSDLADRFGPVPPAVENLLQVVAIKALCRGAGVDKLDAGPKGATISFHNDKFANPAGLVDFIKAQGQGAKVSGNKIVLQRDWKTESDRIKGAFAIARDLAEQVIKGKAAA
jgi:transcription-repair coupling factor (superfamily II helicase)